VAHDAIRKATEALQDKKKPATEAPCTALLEEVHAWAANEATPEQQDKLKDALRTLREHVEAARAEAKAKADAEAKAKEEQATREANEAAEAAKRKADEEDQAKKRQRLTEANRPEPPPEQDVPGGGGPCTVGLVCSTATVPLPSTSRPKPGPLTGLVRSGCS
jgi:hypothetical protein